MKAEITNEVLLDAKNFLRSIDAGTLSTLIEIEEKKYPFGSMCPYVLSLEGEIIILISDIAMHTKNISKDNKASFTVFNSSAKNKQASSRISIVGETRKVEKETKEYDLASSRYLKFFPEAKNYFETHNFNFFTIKPIKVHYIQTFGKIYTFDGSLLRDELPEWAGEEQSVLDHMNNDHKNVFSKYLKKSEIEYNDDLDKLKLLEFDQYGLHLSAGKGTFFYMNFLKKASTLSDLREQFTSLAKD